jgi:N-acetylmuramic acid 6-phosphate etherase
VPAIHQLAGTKARATNLLGISVRPYTSVEFMPDLSTQHLQTEARNPRTAEMDTLPVEELARVLHAENYAVAEAVGQALPEIANAIEVITERLKRGGRLLYIGAGTSGRLGVLDASECPPTFGVEPDTVWGIIAGGDTALRSSIEGAEDDPNAGARALQDARIQTEDVVVGIAASGRTPYVIGALEYARSIGTFTVAVVNVQPSALESVADLTIAVVTGPEALTGSTRLKAGTAQKMVLNLLSTGAMVRLGKTYGNLMVDVKATNEKLRDRAIRIVTAASGCDPEAARVALDQCEWHAKIAIVMLRSDTGADEARTRLARSGGFVRAALE